MWKKIFAASAAAVGIAGILGSGSVFAAETPYNGEVIDIATTSPSICVDALLAADYSGEPIVAYMWNDNYSRQIVFDDFGRVNCLMRPTVPSGTKLRFVIPMGIKNPTLSVSDDGRYELDVKDVSNNYLRSYGSTSRRIGKSTYEIQFDANGGEGTMAAMTNLTPNTNVVLTSNDLTRTDYRFKNWNTEADGSGDSYEDGATVNFATAGIKRLYAQWTPVVARLDYGMTVNVKMKKLSGNTGDVSNSTPDNKIKAIKRSDTLPSGFNTNSADNKLSSYNSLLDVYAWFDNTDRDLDGEGDGTLYFYSDAEIIKGYGNSQTMFDSLDSLTDISGLAEIDMSEVSSIRYTFSSCDSLTDLSPIANWDVSNVKDMHGLFSWSNNISDISPLATWNTSKVKDMAQLFSGLKLDDISSLRTTQRDGYVSWDVSKVENFYDTFGGNRNLSDISVLSSWDTRSAQNMNSMFDGTGIDNIDALSDFNTSNVMRMNGMFNDTKSLNNIDGASGWDTSKVKDMSYMFDGSYVTDISGVTEWDTSSVENMDGMFRRLSSSAPSLSDISPVSKWNTSSVKITRRMFYGVSIVNVDPLRTTQRNGYVSWDVSNVEDMSSMFANEPTLTDISSIDNWDTSNVENMSSLFSGAQIADISMLTATQRDGYVSWDMSKVKDIGSMFSDNGVLSDISVLATWDTSGVTIMSSLFSSCVSIHDFSPIAAWNTSNVTQMGGMFLKTEITNVDFLRTTQRDGYVSWDVSKVESMSRMFWNDYRLTDISALESWNVSSVTDMSSMFTYSYYLSDLSPIYNWAVNTSTTMTNMFMSINGSAVLPAWYHE